MSNFALDTNSSQGEIISSLNYALVNLGSGTGGTVANALIANTTTGEVTNSTSGAVISYLYQYINVRYATAPDGSTGFSTSPTNALYYGLRNSTSPTASTNPTDYIWYGATGGFGTTKFLFYTTYGGYQIQWFVGTAAPDNQYVQTVNATPIDLAIITSTPTVPGTTATVNPSVVNFLQNTDGTFTPSSAVITATFSNVQTTATATVSANLFANGNVTISSITVDPSITVQADNNNSKAVVVNFVATSGASAAGQVNAQSFPVAVLNSSGGANIISSGNVVTTIATPATLIVNYPQGQYVIQGNNGTYTPPAVAGVVTLTANVQALRAGNIIAAGDQLAQYFTANGNYAITSNVATQFNANALTFSSPYATIYNAYQDITYSDSGGTVNGIVSVALLLNGSAGNIGPQGSRGPIPLAYVVTDADPTTASQTQLSSWFQASRTNTVPPIGMGLIQISGDTAQFFFPNPSSVFGGVTTVLTYNGTNWTPVTGQVVSGNVLYTGTVTADRLNVNDVYTLTVRSTNATVGSPTSAGFWLTSDNGDARFAGNTFVGDKLIVGNNAVIGGNLSIGVNTNVGANLRVGNNAQIGSNLNVGASSTIGANLTVGANAVIGTNLTVGANASIGANLTVGANLTIGANLSVGANLRIGNNAVIGSNLTVGNNAVIGGNLNVAGLITGGSLNADTVGTTQVVASAITTAKIASQAVTTSLLALNAVTSSILATNAVTSDKINALAVTQAKIADLAVGTTQLANQAVSNAKILVNSINASTAISSQTITGTLIAQNTITGTLIAQNTITGNLVVPGSIFGNAILANSLAASSIIAGNITATQIAAGTITATQIAASTITGDKIAAATITAAKIQASTITGDKIAANTITTGLIAANTITGNLIQANSISTNLIQANAITTSKIAAGSITANLLAANAIVVGNITSTDAVLGSFSSPGYWLRNDTGSAYFSGNVTVGNVITNGNLGSAVVNYNNIVPGVVPTPAGTNFVPSSIFFASGNTAAYDGQIALLGYIGTMAYTKILVTQDMLSAGQLTFTGTYSASIVSNSYGLNTMFIGLFFNDKLNGGMDVTHYTTTSLINNGGQILNGPFQNNTSFSGNYTMTMKVTINMDTTHVTVGQNIVMGVYLINSNPPGSFTYNAAGNFTFSNQLWNVLYA